MKHHFVVQKRVLFCSVLSQFLHGAKVRTIIVNTKITDKTQILGVYNVIRIKNISQFLNVIKVKDSNPNNTKSADETSFCGVKMCSVLSQFLHVAKEQ